MYCGVNSPEQEGECGKEVKKGVQAGWNGWRKVLGVMCGIKKEFEQKGVEAVLRAATLFGDSDRRQSYR